MVTIKKLAKKVKGVGNTGSDHDLDLAHHECLLKEYTEESPNDTIPVGYFPMYVGEERRRYVVPTTYLSHPLIKILLEKASQEFGFDQRNGLVLPCSVATFQEVLAAIQCNNGQFDLANIFEDLI